jgi:hypothetical protein
MNIWKNSFFNLNSPQNRANLYALTLTQRAVQGAGVYFQVLRNYQILEEIVTVKSNKFRDKVPVFSSFFDCEPLVRFDFAVNSLFKVCCMSLSRN